MSWILIFFVLIFTGTASSDETLVTKESNIIHAEEGESVNITCQVHISNIDSLYLKRILLKPMEVLFATEHGEKLTLNPGYINRTTYVELQNRAIIMVQQVEKSDSDVYMCQYVDKDAKEMKTRGVILAVRDTSVTKLEKCSSFPWLLLIIIILASPLVFALGYFILLRMNVKKYCWKEERREIQSIVYEDMNSFKRNSRVTNPYES